ncbi:hypothetical protein OG883_17020 [Streptomyces sp. NBC_01142]|uniref:hypothetical protein n=1 Tax=Streptomyces sp. NBC_01142 TaxID=2975865 RepID=UPI0022532B0F|nr:hypothetical protein [Streptomyces sp. NBC_01142]MCX4821564.1 hypothetical protein [Streptomyces sp. NBC_01142]
MAALNASVEAAREARGEGEHATVHEMPKKTSGRKTTAATKSTAKKTSAKKTSAHHGRGRHGHAMVLSLPKSPVPPSGTERGRHRRDAAPAPDARALAGKWGRHGSPWR